MMNKDIVIKKFILFCVGFCLYITIETLFRGYSYAIMGVCGGLAVLILDLINDKISWDTDLLIQGILGSCVITGMELIIGKLSLCGVFPIMWDYTNMPFNYQGIVCIPFSLLWILLSFVAIFVADAINYYVFNELPIPYYRIFGHTVIRFKQRY